MTVVLDTQWPAVLPAVVLTECLTGDYRRDYHENRVLRTCDIKPVDEPLAWPSPTPWAARRCSRATRPTSEPSPATRCTGST